MKEKEMEHKYPEFSSKQPEELPEELPAGVWLQAPGEGWVEAVGVLKLASRHPLATWHYRGSMRVAGKERVYDGGANKAWIDWTSVRKIEADANKIKAKAPTIELKVSVDWDDKSVEKPKVDLKAIRAGHVNTLRMELDRPASLGRR